MGPKSKNQKSDGPKAASDKVNTQQFMVKTEGRLFKAKKKAPGQQLLYRGRCLIFTEYRQTGHQRYGGDEGGGGPPVWKKKSGEL